MRAAVEDPVPPGTHGDMMPACRIIFVNERRIKRNASLYTALGLHMKDRKEEMVLDRQKREMLDGFSGGKRNYG
jgi:hypothetical protein